MRYRSQVGFSPFASRANRDRSSSAAVVDGRVAFQTDTEDEFTAAIERLTHRRVVAFLSANQTAPGVACELFFLDAAPLTAATNGDA